jgi:hypothetical protein
LEAVAEVEAVLLQVVVVQEVLLKVGRMLQILV